MNLSTLTRWEPFRDLFTLQDRMNRALGEGFPHPSTPDTGPWTPPVDICEEADRIVLRAEIPGVDKDDIDVKVENGTITLRGEKKHEKQVNTESAYRVERFYGTFSRSFVLPTTIDPDKIQATYKDGVLEVSVPKTEEAKPRKIEVNAS